MSKEPATPPQAGSGEPSSRARGANAAPSPPGTRRSRHASERHAVLHGALHDGAGTSSAMAAEGGHGSHHVLQSQEVGQVVQHPGGQRQERTHRGKECPLPGHGGDGAAQQQAVWRPRQPSYTPVAQMKREQPYTAPPSRPAAQQQPVGGPYPPLGAVQEERRAAPPLPPGGAPPVGGGLPVPKDAPPPRPKRFGPKRKETKTTTFWTPPEPPVAHDARPHQHAPGEAAPPAGAGSLAAAGAAAAPLGGGGLATAAAGAAPLGGGSLAAPGGGAAPPPYGGGGAPRGRAGVAREKTIERVSTLQFGPAVDGSPPSLPEHSQPHQPPLPPEPDAYQRSHQPPLPPERPHQHQETDPRVTPTGPSPGKRVRGSPFIILEGKKKRRPAAICFTLCCILFWLLVVGVGVAILVVYLLYHPQPPRLRVTTATLNAGYVDQLPPPHTGLALNSDLYVLATVYNPNTKVDVVLRYMQLDLYFQGVMIGTQAVWPPIHERPGETALRSVHLVVSEVRISQQNAEVWRNTTAKGGLVEVQLAARFHVQLNFGRWFPFRYWVRPTCALWLDPPPGGALRRARCRK